MQLIKRHLIKERQDRVQERMEGILELEIMKKNKLSFHYFCTPKGNL
jgi:hypothetical protein